MEPVEKSGFFGQKEEIMERMNIRESYEKREESFISSYGCISKNTRGRKTPEPPCPIRTPFQVDRDRIVFSNGFRRLKHKTQVFLSPLGDQYRTRLTHTLEVAQIARTIARSFRLNEDLTEAIALGHDLGHTPFGHSGETALKEVFSPDFSHNSQSLRLVDVLENKGAGLNLTWEVRDGIHKHSKGYGKIVPEDPADRPQTIEGQIVRFADIMAYLNHDLDDAIRSNVIRADQVPEICVKIIGKNHSERATNMIRAIVSASRVENGEFILNVDSGVFSAMTTLREFLYHNVYRSNEVHNEFVKSKKVLKELYFYLLEHPDFLAQELKTMELCASDTQERSVCDCIASMTDRHAVDLYTDIFLPTPLV